jgi:uncharacterized protein (UPF0264 family)
MIDGLSPVTYSSTQLSIAMLMPNNPPQLLVSARSVLEAEAAVAGGADLIDVKEPARGALGRADDSVLAAVQSAVAGKRPTSAALGELREFSGCVPAGFDYLKCGLAGLMGDGGWPVLWERFREAAGASRAVVVAYADWQCAQAPPLDEVVALACRRPGATLLVDTCCKDKSMHGRRATLFDWLPPAWVAALVRDVHQADCRIAMAGSLGFADIARLREMNPDWIAVRGAACQAGDREAGIDPERVRRLKSILQGMPES